MVYFFLNIRLLFILDLLISPFYNEKKKVFTLRVISEMEVTSSSLGVSSCQWDIWKKQPGEDAVRAIFFRGSCSPDSWPGGIFSIQILTCHNSLEEFFLLAS